MTEITARLSTALAGPCRFVMIRRRGAERPSELIVVENWFEELKGMGGN